MKKLFSILIAAVALVAFAPQVKAYDGETATLRTNAITASSAEWLYTKIPCAKQSTVDVHLEFASSGADTGVKTFYFSRTVTGSTNDIETLASRWQTVAITSTGATTTKTITNLPTYGASHLVLVYATNATTAGTYLTNLVVKYGEKPL